MKLKIKTPVIVEGKYDKIRLLSYIDGTVITTDGFRIFNDEEKRKYLKRVCDNGVIIVTDSDGAGALIRGHLNGILPQYKIYNVYIPQIKGKEKRKKEKSAEGLLGVEGMDGETIIRLLSPYADGGVEAKCTLTRAELYAHGLSGGENSAALRKKLCRLADLPENLSAKALCDALCRLYEKEEISGLIDKAKEEE